MQIRDEGLYKEPKERDANGFQKSKYLTFEDYLDGRWEISRQQGYRLLNAANLTQKIAQTEPEILYKKTPICHLLGDKLAKKTTTFLPKYETHIRPLLDKLSTDSERVTVWHNAVGLKKWTMTRLICNYCCVIHRARSAS